jgi:hypothetical protein
MAWQLSDLCAGPAAGGGAAVGANGDGAGTAVDDVTRLGPGEPSRTSHQALRSGSAAGVTRRCRTCEGTGASRPATALSIGASALTGASFGAGNTAGRSRTPEMAGAAGATVAGPVRADRATRLIVAVAAGVARRRRAVELATCPARTFAGPILTSATTRPAASAQCETTQRGDHDQESSFPRHDRTMRDCTCADNKADRSKPR